MPQHGVDDFLDTLSQIGRSGDATAADRVWQLTTAFFEHHGFDKLIYLDAQPGALTMLTTLPAAWIGHYQDNAYARIDPFFSQCCTSFRPVSTGVAYADRHKGLTAAQRTLICEASEFGIHAGFSSTLRLPGAFGVAGWNIGSSLSGAEVDALRADREDALRLAARHVHDMLICVQGACGAQALSPRETECLVLLAQGQRTKDIARTLGLSPAAVELYLRNARNKLGAATREQAIAIGFARGLLSPV
ncbi:helix-turn-helix transcriptional regulator [Pseudotabrizicola alkalilacus]|uniref:LuxR family transcriptional regulator n=1 Tax=Pseudotabrizicola alkalilacus TaxID=2305252 RepID=A0A411Z058_9RHOB|nr:LuxR family transcriptional regulator [Pseudotabrizicola alkalilacus]RGP36428.1 LuxR family transcriptional regulator [Pseudotabrizicola alkalilacus]